MAGSVQLANGARCICGNNDATKFRHYLDRDRDHEHLGSFCLKCEREYVKAEFILDDVKKDEANVLELGKEEFYQAERLDTTDGVHFVHPRKTKIERLDLFGDYLKPGDHIAWERPYIIWHHALVLDIDVANGKVQVIHWHGEGISKTGAIIQEQWIHLKQESGILYRMDYEEDILKENPLRLVIARARSRLGDVGYRFFGDNCEAFVTFCKKGIKKSQQVVALMKLVSDQVKMVLGNIPTKIVTKGLAKASFENIGKVGSAEAMEKVAKNCQWVGFGLVVIIEGCLTIYDLKKLYDARKDGSLSGNEFMEQVSKRVTEALCAGVPAAFGGLVAGWGGIFVGIICGTVGKLIGSQIGKYVGREITRVIRPNDRAVASIKDLHLGDQIVFYGTIVHPRHHCIVLWHEEEESKVNVIHNTYEFGVTQEWVNFVPPFYKVSYHEKECYPPNEVCSRAISKLGTNDYNLLTYNCKHFAEWCKKR
ncbi:uncharacterized protein LOC116303309 [Actinia tenebrosa]|uniref:Uncharacterized protein LOC116303309 n=1 Tax=Actinia tenebrosa TaxID=6105 RepID=A0A6P8IP81_ACTTE|nr:uncharacterized protein LOC116303309 [Actinia tenebrosa]